jgi:hypothetical protein
MQGRPANTIRELRTRLNASLFPSAPRGGTALGRGEKLIVFIALMALAIILQLFRVGPSVGLNSIWAEDGLVFFQGALSQGFVDAVTTPYAEYLVVVPRLIGEVGNLVPLRDAPAAISITSCFVIALSGFVVWWASAAHIRNPILRGTLVVATILAPVASLEAVASGAYALWYMLFATFWLLLWRPATTRGAVLGALFILATALSSPGVLFFAPVVALRAIAARGRRDLLLLGSYVLGVAIQIPVIASSTEGTVTAQWTSDIWTGYLQRVVDGAVFGEALGGTAWENYGWPFLIALLTCLLVGLAFALAHTSRSARYFTVIAIPTSLAMFVVSVYQRAVGSATIWPPNFHFGVGGRYAIVPALLLVSVALVLIDQSGWAKRGPSALSWAGMAVVAIVALSVVTSFDVKESAARGTPSWIDALNEAAATCTEEHLPAAAVKTSPPGFGVALPCDRIVAASDAPAAR